MKYIGLIIAAIFIQLYTCHAQSQKIIANPQSLIYKIGAGPIFTATAAYLEAGIYRRINQPNMNEKNPSLWYAGVNLTRGVINTGKFNDTNRDIDFDIKRRMNNVGIDAMLILIKNKRHINFTFETGLGFDILSDTKPKVFYYPDCIITHSAKPLLSFNFNYGIAWKLNKHFMQQLKIVSRLSAINESFTIDFLNSTNPTIIADKYGTYGYVGIATSLVFINN